MDRKKRKYLLKKRENRKKRQQTGRSFEGRVNEVGDTKNGKEFLRFVLNPPHWRCQKLGEKVILLLT